MMSSKKCYYAWMYGVPCYYDEISEQLMGRNRVWDWMLMRIAIPIDIARIWIMARLIPRYEPAFCFKITGEVKVLKG